MNAAEVAAAVDEGAVVLDLRPPRPFATGHLPGALTMQFNRADLGDRAELQLPQGIRLVVHAEPEPIAKVAVEILGEEGFEVLGHLEGGLAAWREAGHPTETLPLIDVDELHDELDRYTVVDAREGFEHRHGHVPGAVLFPPGDAWERADELPAGTPLAVVCGDQTRSAYVASVLRRRDRDAVLVMGGMVDWLERGFETERTAAPAA
ncbi:MAG TPA: rhodanese-like domain-containing protein [Gaiellaceae bacterium]|nr:rhodanese-like domain-containing protein [Gaiellaceae bacterium]